MFSLHFPLNLLCKCPHFHVQFWSKYWLHSVIAVETWHHWLVPYKPRLHRCLSGGHPCTPLFLPLFSCTAGEGQSPPTPPAASIPAAQLFVSLSPTLQGTLTRKCGLPIHSRTHTSTIAPLNIHKHLFGPGEGDWVGGFMREREREGLWVDTAGPNDALKMSRQSEPWMERFCFGITWRGEEGWRDNTVEKKKKTKRYGRLGVYCVEQAWHLMLLGSIWHG